MQSFCRHARSAAVLALALTACGHNGTHGVSSGASVHELRLVDIDIDPSGVTQLNRPIRFEFDAGIDFATVNSNSIAIRAWNGAPAVGEYRAIGGDAHVIEFQPRCPLHADLSDAGLVLATHYSIDIVGVDESAIDCVRSKSGSALAHSLHFAVTTPANASSAFCDTVAGAPRVLVRGKHSGAPHLSYIELGGDTTHRVYFERDEHGNVSIEPDVELPLALHSELDSRVAFFIAFDQSIDVGAANLARIALEFRGDSGTWHALPALNELVDNCTPRGAIARIEPLGALPPASDVRVVVRAGFSDLVGQALDIDDIELALLRTQPAPTSLHDEILEDFSSSELEDTDPTFTEPRAVWHDGELAMNDNFEGTGGPGGDFDFLVPTGTQLIFDTTHMTIVGGNGFTPQHEVVVEGGVLDVRNFKIAAGATLLAQGPNPLLILASGDVQIEGKLDVSGVSHTGILWGGMGTYRAPEDTVPPFGGLPSWLHSQSGAHGQLGGGDGGASHPASGNSSPPYGGDGTGAFEASGAGGRGGESGWTPLANWDARRGAGGGGGRFGPDVLNPTTGAGAFDQRRIGLDAEPGFDNTQGSNGSMHPGLPPHGGATGTTEFADGDASNDFFGVAVDEIDGTRIAGELHKPWAGSGGGGGGDAIQIPTGGWPAAQASGSSFGGGGGGGGGSLRIIALGHIRFGAVGQIVARGGAGGTGVSTLFLNRVGGAGGGGSGGHVILECATTIEFAASSQPAVLATGGQGGAGAQNLGGASNTTTGVAETLPANDACHAGYSTAGVNACKGQVDGAGGDGGPGVIQLHLFHGIDDIVLPPGKSLADVCQPPPLCAWGARHLQPSIELRSRSRSKWIPIGLGGFDAASDVIAPCEFEFIGTEASSGRVLATNGEVDLAPPILGPSLLAHAPSTPYIEHFGLDVVFDASAWIGTDLAYFLERPHLLRHAIVELRSVDSPALHERFEIVAAQLIENTSLLALWIDGNGQLFDGFQPGGAVEAALHPTWLRAASNGELDALPNSASIRIAFQATTADASGAPDESAATALLYDAAALNDYAAQNPLRFVRFDVLLLGALGGDMDSPDATRPSLDFLRLPWRWRND